ncbi:putative capsular polysaccharide synthesis family protein [Candidatus Epulonipiscium viviparus]|uniref:putative capsular polysaccharide synthesis family protein n=1 Tax=Candidatus Epulonipiscium viviparus TaxID=420336 RepID=UPI0027381417|nr:putative capsular polysaccharide synthesis family protein [Candidatus Epulopiscium viviparus]
MIPVFKTDNNLQIYRENKIVMLGVGKEAAKLIKLFKAFNIEVTAFYNYANQEASKLVDADKVVDQAKFEALVAEENTMIQIALPDAYNAAAAELIKKLNIKNWVSYDEAENVLVFLKVESTFPEDTDWMDKFINDITLYLDSLTLSLNHFLSIYDHNEPIILCMPPKTGDFTLKYTFNKNDIDCYLFPHSSYIFNKKVNLKRNNKLKLTFGLREPIGQNLSLIYHLISHMGDSRVNGLSIRLFQVSLAEKIDVQKIFDNCLMRYSYPDMKKNDLDIVDPYLIQQNISQFCENVIDIMRYPFDKEKGYTIIREGNIEVFVYQLEKLNNLIPELSSWVGIPFDKLENCNMAADKWIADSYKQAQKELVISQEYFDACFNEPYVKHFYSDADIEKFKNRWRSHIR